MILLPSHPEPIHGTVAHLVRCIRPTIWGSLCGAWQAASNRLPRCIQQLPWRLPHPPRCTPLLCHNLCVQLDFAIGCGLVTIYAQSASCISPLSAFIVIDSHYASHYISNAAMSICLSALCSHTSINLLYDVCVLQARLELS